MIYFTDSELEELFRLEMQRDYYQKKITRFMNNVIIKRRLEQLR